MNFITPALAAPLDTQGSATEIITQMAPFGIILLIMYFLILRPQQKRQKEQMDMIKAVRRGDTVISTGGLIGKISKVVDDSEIEVEIAAGVRVRMLRSMIADVRAKGEPVKSEPVKDEPAKPRPVKEPKNGNAKNETAKNDNVKDDSPSDAG